MLATQVKGEMHGAWPRLLVGTLVVLALFAPVRAVAGDALASLATEAMGWTELLSSGGRLAGVGGGLASGAGVFVTLHAVAWATRRVGTWQHVVSVFTSAMLVLSLVFDSSPITFAAAAVSSGSLDATVTVDETVAIANNAGLISGWRAWALFVAVVLVGSELLNVVVFFLFSTVLGYKENIPVYGKHLDRFEITDVLYLLFARFTIIPFAYHFLSYVLLSPNMVHDFGSMTLSNSVAPIPVMFLVYDAFYQPFHRILHIPALYPLVHKHHHRQKVPTRGNLDAINVHPFEFVSGEYLHLGTVWIVSHFMALHRVAALVFLVLGAFVATLNHTRINIEIPGLIGTPYHDIHHSIYPYRNNFSQYTILWDRFWGTFMPQKVVPARKGSTAKGKVG